MTVSHLSTQTGVLCQTIAWIQSTSTLADVTCRRCTRAFDHLETAEEDARSERRRMARCLADIAAADLTDVYTYATRDDTATARMTGEIIASLARFLVETGYAPTVKTEAAA